MTMRMYACTLCKRGLDQVAISAFRNHHSGNLHPVPSGQIEASILAARLNNNILTSTRLYSTRSQDQLPLGDVRKLATALGANSSATMGRNSGAGVRGGSNGNVDLLVDFNGCGSGAGSGARASFDGETLRGRDIRVAGADPVGGMKRPGQSRSSDNILDSAK